MPEPAADDPFIHRTVAQSQAEVVTVRQQRRLQVIVLLEDHMPIREVAARTGYSPRAVSYIARRYREDGLAGLADQREHGAGAPPLLSQELQHELEQVLQHPPPQGGQWTGPKVAQWIAARIGRDVHRQRGWEYLQRLRHNQGVLEEQTSNERSSRKGG